LFATFAQGYRKANSSKVELPVYLSMSTKQKTTTKTTKTTSKWTRATHKKKTGYKNNKGKHVEKHAKHIYNGKTSTHSGIYVYVCMSKRDSYL